MYNDVLEQITEDYFKSKGYFTLHNVPYSLSKQTASDIDVIGIHPTKKDISKVIVVSCKSWDSGVDLKALLNLIKAAPDKKIKTGVMRLERFKEVINKEWITALKAKVFELTGQKKFKLYFSATKYKNLDLKNQFIEYCKSTLTDCPVELISLEEMLLDMQKQIKDNKSKSPLKSYSARIIQLINQSGGEILYSGEIYKSKGLR